MGINIARLGDPTFGYCKRCRREIEGTITTASNDTFANAIGVARLGDTVTCNNGHTGNIDSASQVSFANGRGVARTGDTYSGDYSGSIVPSESPDSFSG